MRLPILLLLCCTWLSSSATAAEETFGEYTVHYIAVNSTFITPEIARQYGIVRGSRNAFVNLAVLRNEVDGSTTPVTATITGSHRNLMQQSVDIGFREIREGSAIYYIGEFSFSNAEILRFNVTVQPESERRPHTFEWRTQLYTD